MKLLNLQCSPLYLIWKAAKTACLTFPSIYIWVVPRAKVRRGPWAPFLLDSISHQSSIVTYLHYTACLLIIPIKILLKSHSVSRIT